MRILGTMVMRNEASRYLDCCLSWNSSIVDAVHVYDDASTDDSMQIAMAHGCTVTRRPDDVPSLLVHEGKFRDAAWRAFERALEPEEGDWVLGFDADEFVVSAKDEVDSLYWACHQADATGVTGLMLPIPEVFATHDSGDFMTHPQIRLDGYWGRIQGLRLFRWERGGHFRDVDLGGGSAPTYAEDGFLEESASLWLMHYGYAHPDDRHEKYNRYLTKPGHAPTHVASIVQQPVLQMWTGPHINVYRGTR